MFLSIVIPIYNEEENLVKLYERLDKVIKDNGYLAEMIFVDDASRDGTFVLLKKLHQEDKRIKVIRLKRNFGQIPAILAGIKIANADTIITLDADLQNPPEEIPEFVEKMKEGYVAVFGYRIKRKDYFLRRFGSFLLWKFISLKMGRKIKDPGCGFNALRKDFFEKIIDKYGMHLKNIKHTIAKESDSFTQVEVSHFARDRGNSKYGLGKLIIYASGFLKEAFSRDTNADIFPYEIEEILK